MRVLRAQAMGLCFGVRDALDLVRSLDEPHRVHIHGELVHNERILVELGRRGFRQSSEADRHTIPDADRVVITAHGVSERERARLAAAGKTIIDATCPLVRRVHDAARDLARRGHFVIVIGRPGHAEVEGIVGDLDAFDVVPDPAAARVYAHLRLGIVCQSTTPPDVADAVRRALHEKNPDAEMTYVDTICRPTRDRQETVASLLDQVDALVVVGGRNSHNTRRLAAQAEARGVPVAHVQGADDLDSEWLAQFEVVGLTAGTSTPDDVIDEVERALLASEATAFLAHV